MLKGWTFFVSNAGWDYIRDYIRFFTLLFKTSIKLYWLIFQSTNQSINAFRFMRLFKWKLCHCLWAKTRCPWSSFSKEFDWRSDKHSEVFQDDSHFLAQVSSSWLWRTGSCDGKVRLSSQRVRMPPGRKEAERQLCQWFSVCVEIWEDRRHDMSNSRLRRLRTR